MNTGSADQFRETFADDASVSAVPPRETWAGMSPSQLNMVKAELEYRVRVYRTNTAAVHQITDGLRYIEFLLSRPVD
jgi:hypothetical protein